LVFLTVMEVELKVSCFIHNLPLEPYHHPQPAFSFTYHLYFIITLQNMFLTTMIKIWDLPSIPNFWLCSFHHLCS
jgi:hypothetical protein